MVLYNVTVSIDASVEEAWVVWMKQTHIPDVMDTGFFMRSRMLRLLTERPDVDGITYAIQYEAESMGHLEKYLEHHAPQLQQEHIGKFGGHFAAFRTVLEEV
jgi:hypothetical protein